MFEKVNKYHPDKIADRIAGAIVDLAYKTEYNPKIAIEVLIGHNNCYIITESSVEFNNNDIYNIVHRIAGSNIITILNQNRQDKYLEANQSNGFRCGDNGIFTGYPITKEEGILTDLVNELQEKFPYDGKYIYDETSDKLIICQSNANNREIYQFVKKYINPKCLIINPLGEWSGGINVDTGAANRKLGSDMGRAITGGGLHGKDLSKADVSINIVCHLLAQKYKSRVNAFCAIGDELITFKIFGLNDITLSYNEIIANAKTYINSIGGFEKFAELGIIR